MALIHKSELESVSLNFTPEGMDAFTHWQVGAWDDVAGKWVGNPSAVMDTLKSTNSDDMRRFNDALGVMHAECVRRTVAAQDALNQAAQTVKSASEVVADQQKHIAELLAENKLVKGEAETARAHRNKVLSENVDLAQEAYLSGKRYRSWLYRLTMGFFGR